MLLHYLVKIDWKRSKTAERQKFSDAFTSGTHRGWLRIWCIAPPAHSFTLPTASLTSENTYLHQAPYSHNGALHGQEARSRQKERHASVWLLLLHIHLKSSGLQSHMGQWLTWQTWYFYHVSSWIWHQLINVICYYETLLIYNCIFCN